MKKNDIKRRTTTLIFFLCVILMTAVYAQDIDDTNVLIVKLPYFSIKMPDFYGNEEGVNPHGYAELYEDRSDEMDDIKLTYSLWDFMGPYGEVFENDLYIIPNQEGFSIVSIEQQYSTTLFFNEDGSGGVWTISDIGKTTSDWVSIKRLDSDHYQTFPVEELALLKTDFSESEIAVADDYVASREIPTTFSESVSDAYIKIVWTVKQDTFTIVLHFEYEYGD